MKLNLCFPLTLGLVLATGSLAQELVLARVGDEVVTDEDLRNEFVERHGGHAKFLLGVVEIDKFLDKVIDRKLLLQEAYRLELDEQPGIREAVAELQSRLVARKFIQEETAGRSAPSEDEIRAAWETKTTTLYRVQHVIVATESEASEVHRLLAEGADMKQLAQERSLARSRGFGGLMSVIGWGTMPEGWEAVVFALEPGGMSRPFRSAEGWEVARLIERQQVEPPPYDAARERIRGILERRNRDRLRADLMKRLGNPRQLEWTSLAELEPQKLADLAATQSESELARWQGGGLRVGDLAARTDLPKLAALPREESWVRTRNQIESEVLESLARLEPKPELARDPEIASQVRIFQDQLMESALYSEHVLKGLSLGEADARSWYDGHLDVYRDPERRQVSHLVVSEREAAVLAARRVQAGEEFAALVTELSQDPTSAARGGDLGWVSVNRATPELAAVFRLELGAISDPVESDYGWHLFKVTATEPGRQLTFDEVKGRALKDVTERRKTALRAQWVHRLREGTPIEIDEVAVQKLAARAAQDLAAPAPPHGPEGMPPPEG